jgi:hypothetical protein
MCPGVLKMRSDLVWGRDLQHHRATATELIQRGSECPNGVIDAQEAIVDWRWVAEGYTDLDA